MTFSTAVTQATMADISYPDLLTAAEFSVGTGGKIAPTDSRVPKLLAGAHAAVRRYCRWHIAPVVDETMVLDYDGSGLIVFPTLRLVDVLSLTVHGEVLDVSELEFSHNGDVRVRSHRAGFRAVTATIRHGFESAPDVAQVVQQVVANAITSPLGATREQAGQVAITWAQTAPNVSGGISLLERDIATLDQYRLSVGA